VDSYAQLGYLARTELEFFPKFASGNKNPKHLSYICQKIQSLIQSKNNRRKLLIFHAPPRHGKTEIVSKHLPPWYLGQDPKGQIMLASYSSSLVKKNSNAAKEVFSKNCGLFNVAPSKHKFTQEEWHTDKGGIVFASGIDGGGTGYGANLYPIDDYFKNHKEAFSIVRRETVWNWWQSVVNTRMYKNSLVVVMATRWHEDDLQGRLINQYNKCIEEGKEFPFEFHYVCLKAIAEENDPLGRKPGEALWPEMYDVNMLNDIKEAIGPYFWEAMYQGNPVPQTGGFFNPEDFRYFYFDYSNKTYVCIRDNKEDLIINSDNLTIECFVDPALEVKKISDYTGMAAWAYDSKNKVFLLLDCKIEKIEYNFIDSEIKSFAFRNKCVKVNIENEKIGKILVKQSHGNDSVNGVTIPYSEQPTGGVDKATRAIPMRTYLSQERVFFMKDAKWLSIFERQLCTFQKEGTGSEHDEAVDILAMAEKMETKTNFFDVFG
jgi:predicted phage terminase large subunit-like protein